MRSLLVYDPRDLNAAIPGGVQLCSQEFLEIVQVASDAVECCGVSICRRTSWRLRRRLHLGSYLFYHPAEAKSLLTEKIERSRPTHVFLNRSELLRLTPLLKEMLPEAQIILMSHGNQSGDDLYELGGLSGLRNRGFAKLVALWQLGQDLGTESWFRHHFLDLVCVMSEEEKVLERWLGAKKTVVLPRLVKADPLRWQPLPGRIGFVGTLDHTPNWVALEQICNEIVQRQPENLELRLVGRPEILGQELAHRFPFVRYLGALEESALKAEVSTWSLFLNPIFWLSRGASMKLGKAIAWGIPFCSTRSGTRGYELSNSEALVTSDNPQEFVSRIFELLDTSNNIHKIRQLVILQLQSKSPSIDDLAQRLSLACGGIVA